MVLKSIFTLACFHRSLVSQQALFSRQAWPRVAGVEQRCAGDE